VGRKLTQEQKALYRRVDEIVFYRWDPLGISDSDWPRDEYETYVPRIFGAVIGNDSPEPIAALLGSIQMEFLGLCQSQQRNLAVAEQMLSIKAALNEAKNP